MFQLGKIKILNSEILLISQFPKFSSEIKSNEQNETRGVKRIRSYKHIVTTTCPTKLVAYRKRVIELRNPTPPSLSKVDSPQSLWNIEPTKCRELGSWPTCLPLPRWGPAYLRLGGGGWIWALPSQLKARPHEPFTLVLDTHFFSFLIFQVVSTKFMKISGGRGGGSRAPLREGSGELTNHEEAGGESTFLEVCNGELTNLGAGGRGYALRSLLWGSRHILKVG